MHVSIAVYYFPYFVYSQTIIAFVGQVLKFIQYFFITRSNLLEKKKHSPGDGSMTDVDIVVL